MRPSEQELKGIFGEYLEHSLRYYILDEAVVSDGYYDGLCQTLLAHWGDFEHKYKHLTDESALTAGSGFQLKPEDIPQIYLLCLKYNRPLKEVFNERRSSDLSDEHSQSESGGSQAVSGGSEVDSDA